MRQHANNGLNILVLSTWLSSCNSGSITAPGQFVGIVYNEKALLMQINVVAKLYNHTTILYS